MKIFIIVLNWNRANDTIECLKSIQGLQTENYELTTVVVDNASTDNSVEEIQKLKFKSQNNKLKFKIIKNKENLGFAAGNNVGIRYALKNDADFVMVLNNDTEVHKDLVVQLIKVARSYPKAGVFSPKIYFAKGFEFHKTRYKKKDLGKVIWYAGGQIDWNNIYGTNRGVDEVDKGQYDQIIDTDFATGSCMFCRATALKKVGVFDEKYFMYLEDSDLSQRMKKAGWKVLYVPYGYLWHKVAQSSGIGSDLNDYFISRNRMLFGMRYAPLRTKLALMRESLKLLFSGRRWQRIGVRDFYLGRLGKGSWK
jgi:hypothetical protein